MSVNSGTFLELYVRHATPSLAFKQRAHNQRVDFERTARAAVLLTPLMSPLAPPYQTYRPAVAIERDRAA
jgi:hypothetical protein